MRSDKIHPFIVKVYYEILEPAFEQYIISHQHLMKSEENWNKLLRFFPDDHDLCIAEKQRLSTYYQGKKNNVGDDDDEVGLEMWNYLKQSWKSLSEKLSKAKLKSKYYHHHCYNPIHSIVFAYTYPRFDRNVSIGINHLLKAPFCLHPNTGKVCVPINPDFSADFDPTSSPSLLSLFNDSQISKGNLSFLSLFLLLITTTSSPACIIIIDMKAIY